MNTSYHDLRRISVLSLPEHISRPFAVIDFETTGLSAETGEIVEFAAVKVSNMEISLKLASLCRPHGYISRATAELTGITAPMVAGYPYFENFLPILLDFLDGCVISAHNAPFDISFLLKYTNAMKLDFKPDIFCTLAASRILFPGLKSRSLGNLISHLGISNDTPHRALGDAEATAQLLVHMMKNC